MLLQAKYLWEKKFLNLILVIGLRSTWRCLHLLIITLYSYIWNRSFILEKNISQRSSVLLLRENITEQCSSQFRFCNVWAMKRTSVAKKCLDDVTKSFFPVTLSSPWGFPPYSPLRSLFSKAQPFVLLFWTQLRNFRNFQYNILNIVFKTVNLTINN